MGVAAALWAVREAALEAFYQALRAYRLIHG
jgi:hypothetical protein